MKNLLLLSIVAIFAASCSGYKVTGNIAGLSGKVYLSCIENDEPVVVDSIQVEDGKFSIDGTLEYPLLAMLQDSAKRPLLIFFLENSDISISGTMDRVDTSLIVGSAEQELFKQAQKKAMSAQSYEEYADSIKSFVVANPKSSAAAYIFSTQMIPMMEPAQIREQIAKFDPSIAKSPYLISAAKRADQMDAVAIGKPFVDLAAADTMGNELTLSSIAGQGKWVLVDFWASWCAPCRQENPNVVKAYNMFKDKGFTILGVSLDTKKEAWIEAIAVDSLGAWSHISDLKGWQSEPAAKYGVRSIPANVLIDPKGVIADKNLTGEKLITILTEKLGATQADDTAKK